MNQRRKPRLAELALVLLPALALAAWAFWLHERGPFQPFKLVLAKPVVRVLPKGPFVESTPHTKGVEVIVFIGHQGPAPSWWGVGVNGSTQRVRFTAKGEKDDHFTNVGSYTGIDYDKARGEYSFVYKGEIPNDPNFLKQATCHIAVMLVTQSVPVKKLSGARASIPGSELI
jgi:hypothetical protein